MSEITAVCTYLERVEYPSPILALASVRLDDADGEPVATIHGVKVIKRRREPCVALPERHVGGRWRPVVVLHGEQVQQQVVDCVVRALSSAALALLPAGERIVEQQDDEAPYNHRARRNVPAEERTALDEYEAL